MTTYRKGGGMEFEVRVTRGTPPWEAEPVDPWETPIEATLLGENALPTVVADPYRLPTVPAQRPPSFREAAEHVRNSWTSAVARENERWRRKRERRGRAA